MFRKYLAALLAATLLLGSVSLPALAETLAPVEAALVETAPAEIAEAAEPEAPAEAPLAEAAPETPAGDAELPAEPAPAEIVEAAEPEVPAAEAPVETTPETPAEAEVLPAEAAGELPAAEPLADAPESAVLALTLAPATGISAQGLTLGVRQTAQLPVTLEPADATATLAYKSSSTKIATVSADGLITAKKAGTATITVVTDNGLKTACKVKVLKAPTSIKLSAKAATLGVGDTLQLSYTLTKNTTAAVEFLSADPAIATVDPQTGLVTARATGNVLIGARTHNGKTAACQLTVLAVPTSITLSAAQITVGRGLTTKISGAVNAGAYGTVTFRAGDESIATVSADGVITGVAPGTAKIYASTYVPGVTAEATVTVVPTPDSVSLPATATLGVKDTLQLTPEIPEGTMATFSYKSSATWVATVSADGLVTGKKAGTATITVTTDNGKKAACKVKVVKAPTSIKLSASAVTLGLGERLQLGYTLTKNTTATVEYASSNPAAVSVDASGLLTAQGLGSATVAARTHNGKTAACQVTVLPAPTGVSLLPGALTLGVGQTAALSAALNSGAGGSIDFVSSNSGVVSVAGDGRVTAVGAGTATVTARSYVSGVSAEAKITVLPAPGAIRVQSALTIGVGDTFRLAPELPEGTMAAVAYSTSSKKVATVSADGWITAKKTGTATITVKTHNGKKAACKVKVVKAPSALQLSEREALLGVGQTLQLRWALSGGASSAVRFASSDEKVARVDENGLVTAVGAGEAVIAAATYNNLQAACRIIVDVPPTSITIAGAAAREAGEGETLSLQATLSAGSHAAITWSTSNPAVAAVNANGLVACVGAGTATITAATYVPGVSASVTITVRPTPTAVSLGQDTLTLQYGATKQLQPQLAPAGASSAFLFASSDPSVVSVSADGLLTAKSRGQARVGVQTYNGLTAFMDVVVVDPQYPTAIASAANLPDVLSIGETAQVTYQLTPASASQEMTWTSTDPAIAAVDGKGKITARSPGLVTIVGISPRNGDLTLEYTFIVLSKEVCLQLPARRTGVDGIAANLDRISAVENSAYQELEKLLNRGTISKAEYTRRKAAVKNAFAMYSFPWMTDEVELYWKEANSEGGAKNFKPGTVYYGMPYTQTNRTYTAAKAVSQGFYTKVAGKNYYKLNNSKISDRQYKGNDCSAFVSMAYFGTNSEYSYLTTTQIARSAAYKTISWDSPLRTGDLICWSGVHVVMFLYYADDAKTQMMLIEQGGDEAAINTVSCSVRKISRYRDQKYVIRRLADFVN